MLLYRLYQTAKYRASSTFNYLNLQQQIHCQTFFTARQICMVFKRPSTADFIQLDSAVQRAHVRLPTLLQLWVCIRTAPTVILRSFTVLAR